ncbi:MAG: hypothetical protein K0B09_13495 [Bacteroidales bacterium]|nr:hypothetical protein [Bacteroidales bacterium]
MKPKKLIFPAILAIIAASATLFYGCSEDEYDFNAIEPIVQGMVGPLEVRGGELITYRAVGRGGSTYAFTKTGAIEQLNPLPDEVHKIIADFDESFEDQEATLSVVETTMGGISSPPYQIDISVKKLDIIIVGTEELSVIEDQPVERTYTVDFKYPSATYVWTVVGEDVEIVGGTNGDTLKVKFLYPSESLQIVDISVEITTRKNNKISDDIEVTVLQFCPLVIEELIGNWSSNVSLGDGECPQTAVVSEVDAENLFVYMTGLGDFLVNCWWGESWAEGDGTVKIELHEPDGLITVPLQWIGLSDYPDNYWVKGFAFEEGVSYHGVYNFCGPTITISFNLAYGSEVGEDGLPLDEDDLVWIFTNPVTSTFTMAPDKNGEISLQLLNVNVKK